MCTVLAFIGVTFMFLFYDRLVENRQSVVLVKATQSAALVSTLFPKNVQERLMATSDVDSGNHGLTAFPGRNHNKGNDSVIADLYMDCTVVFMDLVSFTAWSSSREPAQGIYFLIELISGSIDDG